MVINIFKQLKITIMKKIFTLLFSVGAFATSFAQSGGHSDKMNNGKTNDQYVTSNSYVRADKFDNHRNNVYSFTAKERDQQIAAINAQFNFKVRSIQGSRNISFRQKKMMIQNASVEKNQKIQAVNLKFESKYNAAFSSHVKQADHNRH
jgi:hypothetical protein